MTTTTTPITPRLGRLLSGTLAMAALLIFPALSWGQVSSYSFATSSGTYSEITGGTLLNALGTTRAFDDNNYAANNIGFSFTYNGTAYTQFGVNANGWIMMGSGTPANSYTALSGGTSNNVISAMNRDLASGYGFLGTRTSGSANITAVANVTGASAGQMLSTTIGGWTAGTHAISSISGGGPFTVTMPANATSSNTTTVYQFNRAAVGMTAAHNPTEIRIETIGTTPNRICVVQFKQVKRFGSTAANMNGDVFNFQIRLHETSNVVQIVYGTCATAATTITNNTFQVGLRGSSNADFNNVSSTTSWSAPTNPGASNAATMELTPSILPASGQTYTWTPPTPCSGMPVAGSVSPSSATLCSGGTQVLTASGFTSGVTGLTFQWEESDDNGAGDPWANAVGGSGATTATYTTPALTATRYYRLTVTCTNSSQSASTASTAMTVVSCGSNNVPAAGNNTIACGTNTFLYDNGGSGGNYVANSNGYTVLDNSGTGVISLSGSFTYIEGSWDFLRIYSGSGTGGTLLATYSNSAGGVVAPITSGVGQALTVQFTSDVSGQGGGFALQVLYSGVCSSCNTPTSLAVPTVSANDASFTWTAPGTGTTPVGYNWKVTSDVAGVTTVASGSVAGTSASTSGSPLSANTTYYFWVQSDCGGGSLSSFAGPESFYTGYCQVSVTFTGDHINNFSTTGGLTNITNPSTATGAYEDFTAQSVSQIAGGSVNFSGSYVGGSAGFSIWVDWNNNLVFEAGERMFNAGATAASWTGSFSVPGGQAAGNYRMRIRAQWNTLSPPACGNIGYGQAEDYTFTVSPPPTCYPPTALVVDPTISGGSFSWTAPIPGTVPSGYNWKVTSDAGGTTIVASGTSATTSASTSGTLSANTTYYLFVQSDCGGGDLSAFSTGVSFYTGYCVPSMAFGCTDGDVVAHVILNTLNYNSGTGCPSGLLGYSDYTGLGSQTNLQAGGTYSCEVYAGEFAQQYAAWIDYNDNLIFESSERIGYTVSQVAGSGVSGVLGSSASFPITLSCAPTPGVHRLRIRSIWAGSGTAGNAITPCGTHALGYGETEDYLITIDPPAPCPAPSALVNGVSTSNSHTFSWTAGCTETAWDIFIQNVGGAAPNAGTTPTVNDHGSTSYTATPLVTVQEAWVRADCGGGLTSTWVGPLVIAPTPPNDDCTAATLTTLGQSASANVSGWTVGATNTTDGGNFTVPGYNAVWHQIDLTSCVSNLTISMCGSVGVHTVYWGPLYTGCAQAQFAATASSTNTTTCVDGNITVIYNNLPAGTYYYPVVAGPGLAAGAYEMAISTGAATCPANDDVCDAITITCGSTTAGTTVLATDAGTYESASTCGTAQTVGRGAVWYKVAGDGSLMTASLCATAWDSELQVYSATSCGTLTCIGGNDDGGPACAGTSASYTFLTQSGLDYYIKVSGFGSDNAFSLNLTCCNTSISTLPWTENFDALVTLGTTNFPTCWYESGQGAWLSTNVDPNSPANHLSATTNGQPNIIWTPRFALTGGTSYDFSIFLKNTATVGGNNILLYASDQLGVPQTLLSTIASNDVTTSYVQKIGTFVPATTGDYHFAVIVNGAAASTYLADNFRVEVTPPCATPTITNPLTITGAMQGEVSFACVSCTGDMTIEYGPVGFTPGTGATAGVGGTIVSTTIPNTSTTHTISFPSVATYDVYVREECFGTGYGANAGPAKWYAGDVCLNAIPVTAIPFTHTGTTVGYGDDYSTSPCSNNYMDGNDIVYSFTPSTNQTLALQISGITNNYAGVHIFTNCPGSGTCFGFDSNGFTTAPLIIDPFTVTAGTTYYIVVSTWPAPQFITSFTLEIIPQPQPPINDMICDASWLACGPTGESCETANWVQGTNYAATMLPTPGDPSCVGGVSRDVWYKAKVGPTGHMAIYTQSTTGVNQVDPVVDVFSSDDNTCTGALTSIACNDDGGVGAFSFVYLNGLTPGQIVFIRVSGYGSSAANLGGTFQITATRGHQWTGAVSSNWVLADNWLRGADGIPGAGQNVYIPVTATQPVFTTGNQTINSLWINDGAVLTLNSVGGATTLNVTGNVTGGLSTGGGSIIGTTGTGTFRFNGTTPQTINGRLNVTNVDVNNAAGVSLASGASLYITPQSTTNPGSLDLVSGNFNASLGLVTLMSTTNGTAYLNDFTGGYTGTYTGDIRVERLMFQEGPLQTSQFGYHYIGSPVNTPSLSAQLSEFVPYGPDGVQVTASSNCSQDSLAFGSAYGRIYEWNENNTFSTNCQQWGWTVRSAGTLTNGRGYSAHNSGNATQFMMDFVGTPNTGNIVTGSLGNTNAVGDGWHMGANPYPSAIQWNGGYATGLGFDAQVQLFQLNGPYVGQYIPLAPPFHIASGQGFFFRRTSGAGAFTFTNAMRVTSSPVFYSEVPWYESKLALKVSGNGYNDLTTLFFSNEASEDWDPLYDAHKLPGSSVVPMMYTRSAGVNMTNNAQGLLGDNEYRQVPMDFVAGTAGTYTIKVDELKGFSGFTTIRLEDRKLGLMHDVRNGGDYAFQASPADDADRFMLHFNPRFGTPDAQGVFSVKIYSDEDNLIIANNGDDMMADIQLFNAAGQAVLTIGNKSLAVGNNFIPLSKLAAGVYVVRLTSDKGVETGRITAY